MARNRWSLRDLYRTLVLRVTNPLLDAHDALDGAVRAAYGMRPKEDPLAFLLGLSREVAAKEKKGEALAALGLSPCVTDPAAPTAKDCVQPANHACDFLS